MESEHIKETTHSTYGATPPTPEARSRLLEARVRLLRLMDMRKWHYLYMFVLFTDFVGQMVFLTFTSSTFDRFDSYVILSATLSMACMVIYVIDMTIRLLTLRRLFCTSLASILDFLVLASMIGFLWLRVYRSVYVYKAVLGYFLLSAVHIVLKPRARTFSKKFHKFRSDFERIHISVTSVRLSLRRIPGMTPAAIEALDRDLSMIAGRPDGDMSHEMLLKFLEKALLYRPKDVSTSDFLSYLRDIDASTHAYGTFEVVTSTLAHWSTQRCDLFMVCLVVCLNASINPIQAYILNHLSDKAFPAYANASANDDADLDKALTFGVTGLLCLCIPFAFGDAMMGFFQSKMISKATAQVQTKLLDTVLRQKAAFFLTRSDGDLNNVFQSDLARVNGLWQAVFWNLINPCVSILFGFGYLLYYKPPLGLLSFAFALVLVTSGPQGFAAKQSKMFGSQNAYLASDFANAISCQKVVRAYALETTLVGKFQAVVEKLKSAQFRKDFWSGIVQIYVESAMYIFVAAMTAGLAIQVRHDNLTAGEFFSFVTMLARISTPVTVLGGFMRVAIGNASSLQRIDQLLALGTTPSSSPTSGKTLPPMQTALQFDNVYFQYKPTGPLVLQGLTATIPKGAYTCIVGPSGCGKSSLLNCLMQTVDLKAGAISIDSVDLSQCSKTSIMAQTAVVFQDGGILNGTILDNIRYGKLDATDEECIEAAKWAEADKFINTLADGYNTVMGQHATCNMSGGQVQRVCLARALVRQPSLLLLDEATSALDPETEASIVRTLERLSKTMHMTILSVTHRLSTAHHADLILVLNKGVVAEQGVFDELVEIPNGIFSDMVAQASSEEEKAPEPKKKEDKQAALQVFVDALATRAKMNAALSHGSRRHFSVSHNAEGNHENEPNATHPVV
ncbi:ATP-binding Cassette (ABC) Superfamily [Thraustotheca clavata]|uniref:ATP-binding Cassette (ABC) Superfamily n=1 Tax=Thraustotheca clavata TaxID=74557 RepID=A0A1V9ZQC5_9STRA|nr:ATP-binding Cassette (ABC) Superfamily [Thraustotheca clavata]